MIFPLPESSTPPPHPGQSRTWSKNFNVLQELPSRKKNKIPMEWFHISLFQCKHWSWSRISSFSYSFCSLFITCFSFFWKSFKNPKNSYFHYLFCGQWSLLTKCSLVVEYGKTDIFHFSRSHGLFNPPPLDLSSLGGPVLLSKDTWKYLGFIFDHKLNFRNHIDFYANKAISTIKCMKLLGNSSRGINLLQKRKLYRCCTLPIALYSFPL